MGIVFHAMESIAERPAVVTDSGWRRSGRKGDPAFTHVNDEGQIQVSLDIAREDLPDLSENAADAEEEFAIDSAHWRDVPQMNIVIMIVGSRGDFSFVFQSGSG